MAYSVHRCGGLLVVYILHDRHIGTILVSWHTRVHSLRGYHDTRQYLQQQQQHNSVIVLLKFCENFDS